ncbi:hypothetical protein C477_17065 [Haloterrigena salina JCM 13891]|uniref:Fibronectin type-III domain-containing protein n=1 Tax=Haloterrigena salina JCM 13891 TaxID=1227488 RepID=M0C0G9_9EURY|nr:hypothetical protein C477_17065 [Haloterrigena salina JCM 13891]
MSGPAVGQSSEITVEGGGSDIWNDADEFHYYFTDVGANFDAAVRVDSVEDTDEYAKAGLMLRESLDADAKNVMARTTPDHTTLQWRPTAGGDSTSLTSDAGEGESELDGGTIDAAWQRLVRNGDTIRAYASEDGTNWTLVAELSLSFGESAFLGLAVTSHNTGTLCEATFSNLAGVAPVESRDVGDVDVAGSASGRSSGETGPLIVTGSATDVTSSSATVSSTVSSLGGASSVTVAVEYRESGGSWTTSAPDTVTEPGAVDVALTGLSPETDYEYRAVAEASDGGSDSGAIASFTTPEVDTNPSVTTGAVVDTASSSATLSGTLEALGGQAAEALVSFEYRETGAEAWNASGGRSLSEPGEFETTIYGLASETEYEFRAIVEADDGDTDAGSTATFSTTAATGTGGGSHFDLEDGFADADWFDDSVEVIKVGADFDEIEAAFTKDSKRLIVFEESGVIDLAGADLSITYGDCWVAGQTAPSPGITFINGMVQVEQDNTVVEHIRVLRGDRSGGEGTDPMNSRDGANNVIFNHCSVFWGRDENMSIGYDSTDTTIANCMIAEGLEDPEENSNGTLVGDGADNVAILGTIYAKNNDRNPRLKSGTRTVVVNGLNFYHDKAIWIDDGAEAAVVGNAYIHRFSFRDPLVFGDGSVYMDDNYVADPPLDGRPFSDVGTSLDSPPLWPSGLEALPAGDVESHNKTFAGARPADRISQEEKIVQQITDRWGSLDVDPNEENAGLSDIPDSVAEAGGYPDHGGTTHTLEVPDSGLREWLEGWAVAVEEGGSPP